LIAGDETLVFTKDLEISFWTVWTLDGFGLRRMRGVRINQLSEAKIFLHPDNNKRKTSRFYFYGNYGMLRSLPNVCKVVLRNFIYAM
jgi:hypothetical protein